MVIVTSDFQSSFIPDFGFHLTFKGRSMLLRSFAHGYSLSQKQILHFACILKCYMDSLEPGVVDESDEEDDRKFRGVLKRSRVIDGLPDISDADDVAYKFTDEAGLGYWMQGSLLLRSPAHYRHIENPAARDGAEGMCNLYITDGTHFANFAIGGGYSCRIMCLTRHAPLANRRWMHSKFGPRLIKIHGLHEFVAKVAQLSGSVSAGIKDIEYSDAKAYRAHSPFASAIGETIGEGDLSDARLEALMRKHADEIIEFSDVPAIHCKPREFYHESERRPYFRYAHDVPEEALQVANVSLREHIEVIV
ncbi:hypothetical protein [Rhizobium leguminosarum]|uniref:hypothetical protein n=1 Tax=Rhizobium leguminosarum TaxID=384 RepID=UPI00102F787D|nr:hypothetical protein [Rhizobium leguminosarum]TAX54521.1 hypothetical protein ELI01_04365 [Rhizobium leguminosarum]TAY00387.1 hypothetical protein ELH95_04240 [Rhizobium leguminosarum]